MIVQTRGDRQLVITQPDHARLAAAIMAHCGALAAHPRRASIALAIAEHDNGWAEEDAAPTVDPATGAVVDFLSAPLALRYAVWPRGVRRLAADAWTAALVAQHAIAVHDRAHADPDWAPFFDEMTRLRDGLVAESGLPIEALLADYPFLRLADLISLVFCNGWSKEQAFGRWTIRLSDARVTVEPDPFGGTVIPIAISARVLPGRRWASDEELRAALGRAETTVVDGDVRGAQEG